MKKYSRYKNSGVEWIGEIPEHWEVSKVKFLFDIQKGKTPKKLLDTNEKFSDIYLAMDYLRGKPKQVFYVSDDENVIQTKEDETLLLWDGSNAGEFMKSKKGALSSTMALIESSKVENQFQWYYFKGFERLLKESCNGMGIPHVDGKFFRGSEFLHPPKEEQTQIANYLDYKTSEIDKLIAYKEALIKLLEEERIATINQAVTKGLDPNVPMKDSGIEWLGEIPEHWDLTRIKYVGSFVSGYSFKSDNFTDEGVRVMKISNIQTMRIDWSDDSYLPIEFVDKYERFKVNKGDLVFALTRPIISTGIKAAIVDEYEEILLNQRNAVLKPSKNLNVSWMYYMIFNETFKEHFESLIDGTGQQPNISSTDISNIHIPLPNVSEQIKIISWLDSQGSRIEKTMSNCSKEIVLLKEYKQSLITNVVTGKVDVRDEVIA